MGKIHLLMRKEDIIQEQMKDKIAVVFDVLLATSTITTALYYGAREVVPVLNREEALCEAEGRPENSYVLSGEYGGLTLDGFVSPSPIHLQGKVKDKSMILSTTNGTVAVKKASAAKKVFVGSLLNGPSVADAIQRSLQEESVIVICSGSMERFCLEDFYGAGYFLDCLISGESSWKLTDAARAACLFYQENGKESTEMLGHSRIGQMLERHGLKKDIQYVAMRGVVPVVPYLKGKSIVKDCD